MFRVRRSAQVAHHRTPNGVPIRLRSQQWTLVTGGRRRQVALEYLRPDSVETDTDLVQIRDHLGLVRTVLVLAWVVIALRSLTR